MQFQQGTQLPTNAVPQLSTFYIIKMAGCNRNTEFSASWFCNLVEYVNNIVKNVECVLTRQILIKKFDHVEKIEFAMVKTLKVISMSKIFGRGPQLSMAHNSPLSSTEVERL